MSSRLAATKLEVSRNGRRREGGTSSLTTWEKEKRGANRSAGAGKYGSDQEERGEKYEIDLGGERSGAYVPSSESRLPQRKRKTNTSEGRMRYDIP